MASATHAVAMSVTVGDGVIATVGPGFMGLQYNGPTHRAIDPDSRALVDFPSSYAHRPTRDALHAAGVRTVRVFVETPQVSPSPGVYDWSDVDTAVDEIVAAGMAPMLTLHQRDGAWRGGTPSDPWWNTATGRQEWIDLAGAMATRYGDRAASFELFNEPNHLHPTRPSYLGLDGSADLYVAAAAAVRAAAPGVPIGGPATFGSWEPATWALRVLDRPDGEALLDFVSYHVYATGSSTATDDSIFDNAKRWETDPAAIRTRLAGVTTKPIDLFLTEYNASSVFERDGGLWTDPRNVDATGGLIAALGWLYSARGGADGALRFGTTGGFGLVQWPAEYRLRPAYYATRLLHEAAGFAEGARLLDVTLTDIPGGVEAFALDSAGDLSLVLVNTAEAPVVGATIEWNAPSATLTRHRYDASRVEDALLPFDTLTLAGAAATLDLPARSLTVLTVSPAVAGDYDADGVVGPADYTAWADAYGTGVGLSDGNGDGVVNAADYTVWRDAAAAATQAVPEPCGVLLMLVTACRLVRRRPR